MSKQYKTKSEKIRELLRKGGMSQGDIARNLGVSRQLVYMINRKLKKKGEVTPVPKGKRGRPKKQKWVEVSIPVEAEVAPNKWVEVSYPAEALIPNSVTLPHSLANQSPHQEVDNMKTLDFIESKDLNYRLGTAIESIVRAGRKVNSDPIQDLERAVYFLNREIIIRKGA
jgi:DNA-binding XRE family transcriptional regulator